MPPSEPGSPPDDQPGPPPTDQPGPPPADQPGPPPADQGFPTVPPPPETGQPAQVPPGWAPGDGVGPWTPPPPAGLAGALHPAAIGVWSTAQIGAVVVIFLVNPLSLVAALPFIGVMVVVSAVRWRRFRWQLAEDALVIESGLLNRQRRVIPLERIQSVDLVRKVVHRLFGVVGVQVEAIGSGETEGQLDALDPEVAARLRRALLAGRAAARGDAEGAADLAADRTDVSAEDAGALLASTTPRTLVVAGLTEANATLIAGLFGLAWQVFGDRIDELAQRLPALLAGNAVLVASLAALVVAVALLVAVQLLQFWGFTLHRDAEELRVRRGLLEQRFDTIPLRRLQALRVEENLPRRMLGRASVKADVAGKPGGGSGGTDTLLPLGTAREARALVEAVLDMPGVGDVPLAPMPLRARNRRLFRAVVPVVAVAVPLGLLDPRGFALLLLLVPAVAAALAAYRALGHAEVDDVVIVRAGWWVRRTAYVPTSRLQALAVHQTLFQRWRSLATLELGIARSPGLWSGPQLLDVDRAEAFDVLAALAPVAAAPHGRASTGAADAAEPGGAQPA